MNGQGHSSTIRQVDKSITVIPGVPINRGAWKSRKLKTETDTETDGRNGNIQAIIT